MKKRAILSGTNNGLSTKCILLNVGTINSGDETSFRHLTLHFHWLEKVVMKNRLKDTGRDRERQDILKE